MDSVDILRSNELVADDFSDYVEYTNKLKDDIFSDNINIMQSFENINIILDFHFSQKSNCF